jgi:hypothetical protein
MTRRYVGEGRGQWIDVFEEPDDVEQVLRAAVEDYDRRRKHWWGRLLFWLLRHTT